MSSRADRGRRIGKSVVWSTIPPMQHSTIDSEELHDSFVELIQPVPTELVGVDDTALAPIDIDQLGLTAIQGSRQAVCLTDALVDAPGPRILYINDAYADIFCCEPADVIGQTPRVVQGPLTNRHVLDRLRAHLEAGESVQAQAINYRFDRTAFRLRWSIDPIRRDGVVVGFVAFMRDVTADDRMRRRLSALDALMGRGRVASSLARADRDQEVAAAVAGALRPVVAEIGAASVRIGQTTETTQIDAGLLDGHSTISAEFPIGTAGAVTVDLHPDARDLFDRLVVGELAEHARWLLELGDPI